MSRVVKAPRRRVAIIWVAALAVVVVALMVTEQIALLYVLATLGVTVLLVIVALADLRGGQEPAGQLAAADDAAALGGALPRKVAPRPAKRR